jgi:antitoxin CptB
MQDPHAAIDPAGLGKLRWRCRRGLLENDLFFERFFKMHGDRLTVSQAQALELLIDLPDNDLLDLLLARKEPQGDLNVEPVRNLLALMRIPH